MTDLPDDERERHRSRPTDEREADAGRRRFLRGAAVVGTAVATPGLAAAGRRGRRKPDPGTGVPCGTTEWGDPRALGDGAIRTFTTETPSGRPKAHGVSIDRAALDGLPSAETLEARATSGSPGDKYDDEGLAALIHGKYSLEHFVPFPSTDATPFTFLGLNWNPGGHPPPDVYTEPHFDLHFHVADPAVVDAIEGPRRSNFDVPDDRIPEGYVRPPDPEVGGPVAVSDMGEHLIDPTGPEHHGGTFTNALVWGVYDVDDDGVAEQTFVEPMLTTAYLDGLDGVDRRPVPQPETNALGGPSPTTYSVRDVPSRDALVVAIEHFTHVDDD